MVREPGAVYVTLSSSRRKSGTLYTPPQLTEPIVEYALQPLVYVGPAEGLPEEDWKLKSPREILALKICDPAMGSAAFLVQACRYLGDRLVEAWEDIESFAPSKIIVSPEGDVSEGNVSESIIPKEVSEKIAAARRYVAERCLYGVDRDPMAVEMAKLSLWLVSLQKGRPFTFLDHALKCGDALLGLADINQLENLDSSTNDGHQASIFSEVLLTAVENAKELRRQIETSPSKDISDNEIKEQLLREADDTIHVLRLVADFLVAEDLVRRTNSPEECESRRALQELPSLISSISNDEVSRDIQEFRLPLRSHSMLICLTANIRESLFTGLLSFRNCKTQMALMLSWETLHFEAERAV